MNTKSKRGLPSLGYLIDTIWSRLGEDNELRRMNPLRSTDPHIALHAFGKKIIENCKMSGAQLYPRMSDSDHDTWYRLVGAWVCYIKGNKITRSAAASKINLDASNLTNFINGKRALTTSSLPLFAELFGIEPFDLRPDMGAKYARNLEKVMKKKMVLVKSSVNDIIIDIEALEKKGVNVSSITSKLDKINDVISN